MQYSRVPVNWNSSNRQSQTAGKNNWRNNTVDSVNWYPCQLIVVLLVAWECQLRELWLVESLLYSKNTYESAWHGKHLTNVI